MIDNLSKPSAPSLFERIRRAAHDAAVSGDFATHGALHEIDLSLSDLWHRLERAAKTLRGEPLALVQKLQRNL
jgi:hypothetical protein